jgi:solute carrier family 45 protein 1/2/4
VSKGFDKMSAQVQAYENTGYFAGMIDLMSIFGTSLGDSQFKQLVVVSAFLLMICVSITCFAVKERYLISPGEGNASGVKHMMIQVWKTLRHLPKNIWAICIVLFWAWIGAIP